MIRDYQDEAASKGIKSLRYGKNPEIICIPTGGGKSFVISELCHRLDNRTLILQPTKEILEQNYKKLVSYDIEDIGIYSASMKRKDLGKYTYATIGSIYRSPELFQDFKYVLLDECHLHNPQKDTTMYNSFLKAIGKPKVVGLTATPYRMINQFYTDEYGNKCNVAKVQILNRIYPSFFKSFCFQISVQSLIDKKWLSPIIYTIPSKDIDIRDVVLNTSGSDFDTRTLERVLTSPDSIQTLVGAIIESDYMIPNNLIFCRGVEQARLVSEALNELGYPAEWICGTHSPSERERIISDFREGRITRLVNDSVLSIGFDFPGLYGVTLGAPIMSLGDYYQKVGRAIRTDPSNPSKRALVIDCFKTHKKLGRVETIEITKDGYKDEIRTELGVISGIPIANYKLETHEQV